MIRSPNHNQTPTPNECRSLLRYDPETGLLYWRRRDRSLFSTGRSHSVWNARFADKPALTASEKHGYRLGTINNRMVKAHRVAWAIHYGEWPDVIDHINGDPSDNRIANLRSVSQAGNMKNQRRRSDNQSSRTGVYRTGDTWTAEIKADGVKQWLGSYATLEQAAVARERAEQAMGFHENHGRL